NEMNISYNRQRLKKECDGLKALAEELYRDSTGVASQVWRDITLIPIVHYESGEIVKNYSLHDAIQLYTRMCYETISLPEETFTSGEIYNIPQHKFQILNRLGPMQEGIRIM